MNFALIKKKNKRLRRLLSSTTIQVINKNLKYDKKQRYCYLYILYFYYCLIVWILCTVEWFNFEILKMFLQGKIYVTMIYKSKASNTFVYSLCFIAFLFLPNSIASDTFNKPGKFSKSGGFPCESYFRLCQVINTLKNVFSQNVSLLANLVKYMSIFILNLSF